MRYQPLWFVAYETTAVTNLHVAAANPAAAITAIEQREAARSRRPVTVHIRKIERIGEVLLP